MKCKYRNCENLVYGKASKLYCCKKCKWSEKYCRKSNKSISVRAIKLPKINLDKDKKILVNVPELVQEKITINISYRNITHYLKLGYNAILNNQLEINTLDLPTSSHVRIDVCCQKCGKINNLRFHKYFSNKIRGGIYTCKSCKTFRSDICEIRRSEDDYKDISKIEYSLYKNEVRRLSKKSVKVLYLNWDGYDFYDGEYIKEYLNLSHIDNRYPSVDHKISIYYGFINGIPAEKISDISNLCITKRFINSTKRALINF